MANDDQQLIQQALNGDLTAFNTLVLRYQDRVYSLCYRIMGDSSSAADTAQDAFITAYRRLDTYRGGNFRSWLLRIATNTCYDELRRRQRRPTESLDAPAESDFDDGPPIADNSPTPEQAMQQQELSKLLQDCINGLGDSHRSVLILSDVEGLSYQEIADSVDANLGTVKSRLSRARLAMRDCLESVQELLPAVYRLNYSDNEQLEP